MEGSTMSKWRYLIEEANLSEGTDPLVKVLEDCGMGGWEAVSVLALPGPGSRFLVIFKQPSDTDST
jgi:hypothetical protein